MPRKIYNQMQGKSEFVVTGNIEERVGILSGRGQALACQYFLLPNCVSPGACYTQKGDAALNQSAF